METNLLLRVFANGGGVELDWVQVCEEALSYRARKYSSKKGKWGIDSAFDL